MMVYVMYFNIGLAIAGVVVWVGVVAIFVLA